MGVAPRFGTDNRSKKMNDLGQQLSFLIDSVKAVLEMEGASEDTYYEAERALESLMKSAGIAGYNLVQGE